MLRPDDPEAERRERQALSAGMRFDMTELTIDQERDALLPKIEHDQRELGAAVGEMRGFENWHRHDGCTYRCGEKGGG